MKFKPGTTEEENGTETLFCPDVFGGGTNKRPPADMQGEKSQMHCRSNMTNEREARLITIYEYPVCIW